MGIWSGSCENLTFETSGEDQVAMLEASVERSFIGSADLLSAGTRDRQGIGSPR